MKRFRVKGYALVPVEIAMEVVAQNEAQAKQQAEMIFKRPSTKRQQLIVPGTDDELAVHDFRANEATEVARA